MSPRLNAAQSRGSKHAGLGDWQTPMDLARRVVAIVRQRMPRPACILEPTCGQGAFLAAALEAFPGARALGFDISTAHVTVARARLAPLAERVSLEVADFFQLRWGEVVADLPEPILIIGNPPWVTNSAQGTLGARNLPQKTNLGRHAGLSALTGKSNFDISEWMISNLLEALSGRAFELAVLCKASVARRVMEHAAARGQAWEGEVFALDTRLHFGAAVDAVLLSVRPEKPMTRAPAGGPGASQRCAMQGGLRWGVRPSLDARAATRFMGVVGGKVCSDLDAQRATAHLEGPGTPTFRSGIKHDCAKVMELELRAGDLVNGWGEVVPLEPHYVYPLFKGSDVFHGRQLTSRRVVVTQSVLGEDTSAIAERAPATWRYLQSHRQRFDARRSRIYRRQPPFALFGIGQYAFALYKVAICGLYKRLVFTPLGPIDGRPPMVDDTTYFVPCATARDAVELAGALNGQLARDFFEARVFWDAKRPITQALLSSLSVDALLRLTRRELT